MGSFLPNTGIYALIYIYLSTETEWTFEAVMRNICVTIRQPLPLKTGRVGYERAHLSALNFVEFWVERAHFLKCEFEREFSSEINWVLSVKWTLIFRAHSLVQIPKLLKLSEIDFWGFCLVCWRNYFSKYCDPLSWGMMSSAADSLRVAYEEAIWKQRRHKKLTHHISVLLSTASNVWAT